MRTRVLRTLEQTAVRITRAVRLRPELTVVLIGPASGCADDLRRQTLAPRRWEVRFGPDGLARARGRWVILLDEDVTIAPGFLAGMLRAAQRRVPVVPDSDAAYLGDATSLLTGAVLLAGTALPARHARAAGYATDLGPAAGVVHRARAVAQLNRTPLLAAVAAPQAPATVPQAPSIARARRWFPALAALAAVEARGPRVAAALAEVRAAISERAGDDVSADPAEHRRLLEQLGEVPEPGVDLEGLRAPLARDLAIVYAFPPLLDTGGFVVARRFAGRDPYDLVTQDMSSRRPTDARSLELIRGQVGRRMVAHGPVAAGNWRGIERFCRAGMAKIDLRESARGEYRSLYSRSMWIAPSVLAAWYKARHPDVPWTAELSDPLALRPTGDRRPDLVVPSEILHDIEAAVRERGMPGRPSDLFFETVEWMVYSLADRIVFTNEHQRTIMLEAYSDPSIVDAVIARSEIQRHPTPGPELYRRGAADLALPAEAQGRIAIGYFGNFYNVRGVGDLLDPFALLDGAERDRVRLLIFTATVDKAQADVDAHPARDMVTVLPALAYFDFLAMTTMVDWLIVADAHRPPEFRLNPYLPSKAADYRGSGTPVWGLVDEGSMLSASGLREQSPLGDAAAGAAVLRRIIASG